MSKQTLKSLQQRLERSAKARERRRLLSRMATALEAAFLIQPGTGLVCLLGNGSERDNHEALITWLEQEVEQAEEVLTTSLLPELAGRLDKTLTRWELDREV